jgi:hypothetical protein
VALVTCGVSGWARGAFGAADGALAAHFPALIENP